MQVGQKLHLIHSHLEDFCCVLHVHVRSVSLDLSGLSSAVCCQFKGAGKGPHASLIRRYQASVVNRSQAAGPEHKP